MAREFQGDPYRVLGIARDATPADVKRAFRKLAKIHHPDIDSSPGAARVMVQINAAYEMLRDPARRARWDGRHPAGAGPRVDGKADPTREPRPGGPTAGSARGPQRPSAGKAGPRPPGAPPGRRPQPEPAGPEPTLDEAFAFVIGFGKFRGSTLGRIAAVEPGYLRWILRAIRDRPDLVRNVRVVVAHLDRQAAEASSPHGHGPSARPSSHQGTTAGNATGSTPPTPRPPRWEPPAERARDERRPAAPAVRRRRGLRRPAAVLAAVAALAGVGLGIVRLPTPTPAQPVAVTAPSASASSSPAPVATTTPTASPSPTPDPVPTPSPAVTPVPTPFRPNAVRKVASQVVAGVNFNGGLEPYTLVLNGPKSLDMADLEYLGFIQFDVRLSATAKKTDDCRFAAWQEDQEFDSTPGNGAWVEEARWELEPGRGETKTAHEPKLIVLGLGRRLHVRTDCAAWTIRVRGVDLGHGKVPGAPRAWDGLSDLNCTDFGSSAQATEFLSYFGEKGSMLYELDGDGDGVACDGW